MINEKGEIVQVATVPDLVEALEQVKCGEHGPGVEECHRCTDLSMAALMLTVFDKLVMIYNQDHNCLDPSQCKVCVMIEAYGLKLEPAMEDSKIVTIH